MIILRIKENGGLLGAYKSLINGGDDNNDDDRDMAKRWQGLSWSVTLQKWVLA